MEPSPRLIGLTVHGVGTAEVESLASYFQRIRRVNCGGYTEWRREINQPNDIGDPKLLRHGYKKAMLVKQWLVAHGSPDDVMRLSFHETPWVKIGDFRKTRAWCGSCIKEGLQYEPALWTFKDYVVCHKHEEILLESCPHCGKKPARDTTSTHRPCKCDHCGLRINKSGEKSNDVWLRYCSGEIRRWVETYQQTAPIAPPTAIGITEHTDPRNGGFQTLLFWSWITGRDPISLKKTAEPRPPEQCSTVPVPTVMDRFFTNKSPHVAETLPEWHEQYLQKLRAISRESKDRKNPGRAKRRIERSQRS